MRSKAMLNRWFMAVVSFSTSSNFTATLAGADWSEFVSLCEVSCFNSYTDANVSMMLALRSHQRVNHSGFLVLHMGDFQGDVGQNSTKLQFFSNCGENHIWLTPPSHPNSVNKPYLNFELITQTQLVWLAVLLRILQMAVISIGKRGCRILLNTHRFLPACLIPTSPSIRSSC